MRANYVHEKYPQITKKVKNNSIIKRERELVIFILFVVCVYY